MIESRRWLSSDLVSIACVKTTKSENAHQISHVVLAISATIQLFTNKSSIHHLKYHSSVKNHSKTIKHQTVAIKHVHRIHLICRLSYKLHRWIIKPQTVDRRQIKVIEIKRSFCQQLECCFKTSNDALLNAVPCWISAHNPILFHNHLLQNWAIKP